MAEKMLRVTMPDDSRWDIPARIIADNRASYYAENDEHTTYQEEFEYAMGDAEELTDWAANNMNWSDVESEASLLDRCPVDFDDGWRNGEKEVV